MKTSDAQYRAIRKYDAQNTKKYIFKFNKKTDADIIEKLDRQPNKAGYIKKLIRDDQ